MLVLFQWKNIPGKWPTCILTTIEENTTRFVIKIYDRAILTMFHIRLKKIYMWRKKYAEDENVYKKRL